jgi:hypothetical protein
MEISEQQKKELKRWAITCLIIMVIFSAGYLIGVYESTKTMEKAIIEKYDCYDKAEYEGYEGSCFKKIGERL